MPRRISRVVSIAAFCALLVLFQFGSAAADDKPSGCAQPPEKVTVDTTPPINIGILANALTYYRCTEYDAEVTAALNAARAWVGKRASEVAKPAIVLDIDETSLSNWDEIHHNNFGYIPSGACDLGASAACGQRAWELSARAAAIEPTLELFNFAKTLKDKNGDSVDIYFVTGRYEDPFERIATEWNLHRVGYDQWRKLFMRPDSSRSDKYVSKYKTWARTQIEADHIIIANVGDQYSDLVGDQSGDHAERCFKVPNPFYFIPGDPIPSGCLKCLGAMTR
jgi:predicted secreted acid phosphatase